MPVIEKLRNVLIDVYSASGAILPKQCADNAIDYLNGKSPLTHDCSVKAIKGGTYKIKGYYMENNELQDIRGASTLISTIQDDLLPEKLKSLLGYDGVLFNGGGNLFALVPENIQPDIANILEEIADSLLITANSAYYLSEPFMLSDFLGKQYKWLMAKFETELNERKKAKVCFDVKPITQYLKQNLLGSDLSANDLVKTGIYCEKCRKRLATYERKGKILCAGCLHKVHAGEMQKSHYLDEYSQFTGISCIVPKTFADIDREHIAVVYADGNNMGGIIQNIDSIEKMIHFSDFVKTTMSRIVYSSLSECNITSPEIVALGGDDVFLIIPAEKSVSFAVKLIEKYRKAFSEEFQRADSTLSVGFCIVKPKTPVKAALEVAEEEMSSAKKLVRENGGEGSLSFRVFNTYEGSVSERGAETLMPYSVKAAEQLLDYSSSLHKMGDIKTRLQNMSEAFAKADIPEEASLFMDYNNAKESKGKQLELPELDGYVLRDGYYTRNGKYQNGRIGYVWNDLIYLMKFGKRSDIA